MAHSLVQEHVSGSGGFTGQTGQRIPLRVSTFVTSIHNINAAGNSFDCDFTLSMSWDDPQVVEKNIARNTYLTLDGDVLNKDLRPDVFLVNDMAGQNDKDLVAEEIYVVDAAKGTVVNNRRMRGTFYQPFDLHAFPFDVHTLTVKMYFHSAYQLSGPVPGIKTEWWGRVANNEFLVGDALQDRQYDIKSKGSGLTFEGYEFSVVVARQYFSYLTNILIVVEGLFFLGLSVHLLDHTELNDRINLTLIIVLTYSAFKMMVASMVPAIGYMTLLDRIVMTGFCMGMVGGILTLVMNWLEFDAEQARAMDKNAITIEVCIWALLHVWSISKSGLWNRRRFLSEGWAAQQHEKPGFQHM